MLIEEEADLLEDEAELLVEGLSWLEALLDGAVLVVDSEEVPVL